MSDYLGGDTVAELQERLLKITLQAVEGSKLDFKSEINFDEKKALAELAKDISSIANTDDENHHNDLGYIILGAERGKLLGGVAALNADLDKLQGSLTEKLANYLAPVPQFTIKAFHDNSLGWWGAIVIPPSSRQPHIFIKDTETASKHEWFVRVNDINARGSAQDYARFIEKSVRRAVRPMETALQRLSLQLENQASATPSFAALTSLLSKSERAVASSPYVASEMTMTSAIRQHFVRGEMYLEDLLFAEALKISELINETSTEFPWSFFGFANDRIRSVLEYVEQKTLPFAEALATIVRYDRQSVLTGAICRAITIIAHEPQPRGGQYQENISKFRLYPLVLSLHAIALVAVNERREQLLKQLFGLALVRDERNTDRPLVAALDRVLYSVDVFDGVHGKKLNQPVSARVREVLLPRIAPLCLGVGADEAFFVSEFVLGLAMISSTERPLPAMYLTEPAARMPIRRFLRRRPEWLSVVLGKDITSLLQSFDTHAKEVAVRLPWEDADGFVKGALSAYEMKDDLSV